MKTRIIFQSRVLQEVSSSPSETVKALERHFSLTWPELQNQGMSVWPTPTEIDKVRTKEDIIADCTEPNGSVWGVRFFEVYAPGFLISPTSRWVWESATQLVPSFSNIQAVRGHHGFHAAWVEDFQNWSASDVDHHNTHCKALVKGFGDVILGTEGWRSSKMAVMKVLLTEGYLLEGLKKRYPEVDFAVGTWQTSEASKIEWLAFPHQVKRIPTWLRGKSLKVMLDEFEV